MSMHLNGGSKFSELRFQLFRDGVEAAITRVTRTSGSPQYYRTVDKLVASNGDEFDVIATRGEGLMLWLEAHRPAASPSDSVGTDVEPPDVPGGSK